MSEPIDKNYIDLRAKEVMAKKGVTVNELAQRMGKHPQYITNIINVSQATSLGSLIAVAKALGVPFRDLFGPGAGQSEKLGVRNEEFSSDAPLQAHCPHCHKPINILLTPNS